MVIEPTPKVMEKFKKQGYPVSEAANKLLANYKLPKLDDFWAAPTASHTKTRRKSSRSSSARSTRALRRSFSTPRSKTECLKAITGSWQQRSWEAPCSPIRR